MLRAQLAQVADRLVLVTHQDVCFVGAGPALLEALEEELLAPIELAPAAEEEVLAPTELAPAAEEVLAPTELKGIAPAVEEALATAELEGEVGAPAGLVGAELPVARELEGDDEGRSFRSNSTSSISLSEDPSDSTSRVPVKIGVSSSFQRPLDASGFTCLTTPTFALEPHAGFLALGMEAKPCCICSNSSSASVVDFGAFAFTTSPMLKSLVLAIPTISTRCISFGRFLQVS